MNTKEDSFFITFISLLILVMLLLFFGVYSYFFSVKDYTLIAGIIAFIGAIIGGAITLVGVNKTLLKQEKRELESKKLIKKRLIRLLEYTYNMIYNIPPTGLLDMSKSVYDPRWGEYLGEMDEIEDEDIRIIAGWLSSLQRLEQLALDQQGYVSVEDVRGYTNTNVSRIYNIINKYK